MLDQTPQTTEAVLKIPWSVAGPIILQGLAIIFLVIRELIKGRDFKAKNGILNEIKQGITQIQSKQQAQETICKTVSGQLKKQTDDNTDQILELWKTQGGKKPE